MSRTYADFLAEAGVTLAELTTEQKITMHAAYLQTQTGNITSTHMYLSIPLLFNETNTMASIIYLFSDSFSHCHHRSRYVILFV
jgi:hypothetical protein